jgi:4,5-DOPA dioxygenase extradiol
MERNTFLKLIGLSTIGLSMTSLADLNRISHGFTKTQKMPVLFVGHGSPMNAIEENQFVQGFRNAAKSIPKPNAILCVSAHWLTNGTKVTAMGMPPTIHDFGGFPQALFDVQYPALGSPELATEAQKLLAPTHVDLDDAWGLDHGTWSVLKHFYPDADIPVIQLSIDYGKPMQWHFDLAKQLQTLREKGILIIGSGNMVHNLGRVDFSRISEVGYGYDWAIEARSVLNKELLDGNFQAMIDYQKGPKSLQLAIPTPDHYIPLLYTLGLKTKADELSLFNDQLLAGSLSMTSVRIG